MASPSNSNILNILYCIAPQFKDPSQDDLECYNSLIEVLRCQVNAKTIGCCANLAFAYLLAHMLTIRSNPNTGVASSMSEGQLSISFAVSSDSEYLNSTSYGKAYVDLINRTVFAPTVTNLPSNFYPLGIYGSCGC